MSKNDDKVTIFFIGENSFTGNVKAIEARLHLHGRKKYAQYDGAVQVVFTPKGKRTKRELILTYKPYVIIVKGWGHGEPPSPWVMHSEGGAKGVTTMTSKHTAFSDGWIKDFEAWFDPKLASFDIVADYRGANTYERKYT